MVSKLVRFLFNILLALILISAISFNPIRAHTFSSNESASFFSLVDQIKSVLLPIKQDVSTDVTLADEQAQYARSLLTENVTKELKERNQRISTELISMLDSLQNISSKNVNGNLSSLGDILAEAVTVRIEKDQLHNVTIQALAFANDINKILSDYSAAAKGHKASVNMDMSSMSMSTKTIGNNGTLNRDMNMTNNANNKENITNMAAYQRAGALIDIATERFNNELKGKSNITAAMDQVIKGLEQLKLAISGRAPIENVMGIVHGQIHPNLQTAFNLQLTQVTKHGNDNMSMNMSISNMNNNNQSKQPKTTD